MVVLCSPVWPPIVHVVLNLHDLGKGKEKKIDRSQNFAFSPLINVRVISIIYRVWAHTVLNYLFILTSGRLRYFLWSYLFVYWNRPKENYLICYLSSMLNLVSISLAPSKSFNRLRFNQLCFLTDFSSWKAVTGLAINKWFRLIWDYL